MSDAPPPMSYVEVPPPADLAPWIAALWCFRVRPEAGEIEHRIPLTGGLLLAVGRAGPAILTGPRTAPLVTAVRGGDVYWGVHCLPGAAGALFHLPPGSLRDQLGPAETWLDPAWCLGFRPEENNVDDAQVLHRLALALRELAPRAAPLDAAVTAAVAQIVRSQGAVAIAELAGAVALSPRQLRRRFQAAVGLSPKELARVRRLRAAAATAVLHERPWSEVAGDGGYADQAHLVREFRSLLGTTPGGFGQHARRIDHRLVE
jgi:AraC-like DNA-binding protein